MVIYELPQFAHRWSVVMLSLAVLCGCAGAGQKPTPRDLAEIDNIAIASLLGDDFHLIHVGMTQFGTERYVDSASAWNIDELITDRLQSEVGRSGTVRVEVLGRSEITDAVRPNELSLPALVRSAASKGYETAIVVRRTGEPRAANIVGGYGLLHIRRYPAPGLSRCVFSALTVDVVDVHTMAILKSELAQNCRVDIDVGFYPRLADFPTAEESLLRRTLEEDLTRSTLKILRRFGLI